MEKVLRYIPRFDQWKFAGLAILLTILPNSKSYAQLEVDLVGEAPSCGDYTDGKVNASLKGDLTPDGITLDQAVELINHRRANPPKKRKRRTTKKKK